VDGPLAVRHLRHPEVATDISGPLATALGLARCEEGRSEQAIERATNARGRRLGISMAAYVALTGLRFGNAVPGDPPAA